MLSLLSGVIFLPSHCDCWDYLELAVTTEMHSFGGCFVADDEFKLLSSLVEFMCGVCVFHLIE